MKNEAIAWKWQRHVIAHAQGNAFEPRRSAAGSRKPRDLRQMVAERAAPDPHEAQGLRAP